MYTDVDECSYGNAMTSSGGPCGSHSTCVNTVGSYSCQCNEGHYLTDAGLLQRPYCTGASNVMQSSLPCCSINPLQHKLSTQERRLCLSLYVSLIVEDHFDVA